MNKHIFLQQLILNINSTLELSEAMNATFLYLAEHFPIAGITLHRFIPEEKSVQFDFLLTDTGFHEFDSKIEVSASELDFLTQHEITQELEYGDSAQDHSLAKKFNQVLSDYLPILDRTYLATILTVGTEVVGHFCLVGTHANCFTQKHETLLEVMRSSLGMIMLHLLKHYKIQKNKLRIEEEKFHQSEIELLKGLPIIGKNSALQDATKAIEQLAMSNAPVLITGETGTGKELIADAVQHLSAQKNTVYLKINCGAIPETLIDSELFGFQKGAFTGATHHKTGKFEQANGGTLFLDEIGELSLQSQVRLLRVLQDNSIQRIGGTKPIPVNVRIIAATNRPLETMIQAGTFREDLFHRLNVFPLHLPPLRERRDDIPLLVNHFVKEFCKKLNIPTEVIVNIHSLELVKNYSWPGNIRELKNLIQRALTLNPYEVLDLSKYLPQIPQSTQPNNEQVNLSNLQSLIQAEVAKALSEKTDDKKSNTKTSEIIHSNENKADLALDKVMSDHIKKVLALCNYKISGKGGAAEVLQINPSTLRKKMQKLNIQLERIV